MVEWFNNLTELQRIFAYIAIPSTLLLIVQTIMLLFGLHGHDGDSDSNDFGYESSDGGVDIDGDGVPDFDPDIDADGNGIPDRLEGAANDHGLRLFTVRGLVAFFSIMGWTGIVLSKNELPNVWAIIIAIIAGAAAMLITALVLKFALKLQSDGTMDIKNALGVSGTVYITVPAERKDKGKVNLVLQGQYGEFDAVTDEKDALTYGTEVTVIGVSGANTLVVKKK
ncbi:MAG: hypothetical protein IJS94_08200 [Clostridia bacterium]|nr:hypothetical protein [Clostridia bacterium]